MLAPSSTPAASEPVVKFWLYFEDSAGHLVGDSQSDVYLVGGHKEHLGKTDAEGEFAVAKALITSNRDAALLFCRPERAQCVAVILERLKIGFDEYNLRVPPDEIVDRFKVNASQ